MGIAVSVIIPIHNGAKYIKKMAKKILHQSLNDLELILVENNSKDNSLDICRQIAESDNRVTVIRSKKKGTSFARKKGIERAKGRFIFLCDQDDDLIDEDALKNMYLEALESNADICQFNYYKNYGFKLKRKVTLVTAPVNYDGCEVRNKQIKDIFISGRITPNVWNKLYRSEVIKEAVKNVNVELFFAEDMNLNFYCFFSKCFSSIYLSPNTYYLWRSGSGFTSSSQPELVLMEDYEKIKPDMLKTLQKTGSSKEAVSALHMESLLFMKYYYISFCSKNKQDAASREKEYHRINNFTFVKMAKRYFFSLKQKDNLTSDIIFLASNNSCLEFYNHYKDEIDSYNSLSKKIKIYFVALRKIFFSRTRKKI